MTKAGNSPHKQIFLAVVILFIFLVPPVIYISVQPVVQHFDEVSLRHSQNLQTIATLSRGNSDAAVVQAAVQELTGQERELSRKSFRDALLSACARFLVGGLFTALLTTFLVVRKLVEPLISLCRQIKEISSNRSHDLKIDVKGGPEFQEISNAFNRHMELLQEKDRQLLHAQQMELAGLLAGGMVHEFNTVLTIIRGFADHLQKKLPLEDPLRKITDHIINAVNRGRHLTGALRPFQREGLIQPEPVEMNLMLQELRDEHEKLVGHTTAIEVEPHGGPVWVMGDRHFLQQVLVNIINNACDAMPQGGVIAISNSIDALDGTFLRGSDWAEPGRYAAISISDSGIGMDEDTIDRIFQPFFTTKEIGQGTGLGLTMAYGIIREHKGLLSVQSRPNAGTAVTVYLPVIDPP
jgi:signal transduction histidine kinase